MLIVNKDILAGTIQYHTDTWYIAWCWHSKIEVMYHLLIWTGIEEHPVPVPNQYSMVLLVQTGALWYLNSRLIVYLYLVP